MRSFIAVLILCNFILEFGSPRESKDIWPRLFERRRILDGKISEYIDTDIISNNRSKPDPNPLTINSSRMETSQVESLRNDSVSTVTFYNSLATEKRLQNISTRDPGPKNYRQKFQKYNNTENKTETIVETINWYSLKSLKKVNKEIRKSQKFHWNNMKTGCNKQTVNRRGNRKRNDVRNQRLFRSLTERGETNIPFQYKLISVKSIGKVSEGNTEMPTSRMESREVFVSNLPHATTNIINHSPDLMFNRAYFESNSNITNSSMAVHLPPSPNSRLSKTAVAAIVAAINGIIGFTGAAIFTCTKHNYVLSGERRPLIR